MIAPRETHVEWTMPAPLWSGTGDPSVDSNRQRFRTPALLRFANDSFMQEFLDLLNTEPQRLSQYVAAPETWSAPPTEPMAPVSKLGLALKLQRVRNATVKRLEARGSAVIGGPQSSLPSGSVFKLYQPSHGRFYLVTTCLVCRTVGLPDRRIDSGAGEKVSFVLRLLQPMASAAAKNPDPRDCTELAFISGAWVPVKDAASLADGEDKSALFPATYPEDDGRNRRLLAGLIPVGDRERLLQAPRIAASSDSSVSSTSATSPMDPRQVLLKASVIGPLKNLEDVATAARLAAMDPVSDPATTTDQQKRILQKANDQIQQISWYLLLDLARFLETWMPDFWQAAQANPTSPSVTGAQQTLWNTLTQTRFVGMSLAEAMLAAYAASSLLESAKTTFQATSPAGWPTFRFAFYTATTTTTQGLSPALARDTFESQIVAALSATPARPPLPTAALAQVAINPQDQVYFCIRCVLERPNCGALTAPSVSEPTSSFQMAAYFDPDAPARPIRIGLPVDTSPAGLRKFNKNTAFVMSETLCGQVNKMSGVSFGDLIRSVLPFPLHADLDAGGGTPCSQGGISFGMVCSFSIPIITICALILLIIFVKLLDIVFFWMPFFQICLPVPKFSAKES